MVDFQRLLDLVQKDPSAVFPGQGVGPIPTPTPKHTPAPKFSRAAKVRIQRPDRATNQSSFVNAARKRLEQPVGDDREMMY